MREDEQRPAPRVISWRQVGAATADAASLVREKSPETALSAGGPRCLHSDRAHMIEIAMQEEECTVDLVAAESGNAAVDTLRQVSRHQGKIDVYPR
ncbi:hypothetical protein PYCCODRAFT_1440270 [Trametes coccinea BRFM310]|uniref:Uncharacterized protein n=1 Tax=Trametes coccinea (strain BRFM310) TaxID=1353009 RepID=A0A1Y2I8F0_TRAC3|nr:hypothetical protein PYCCODRAFT_1440958 [Trametes coccinea BRFM310]OSC97404.1 hypothetical protein PYCCODRAFT_1440270 [Trametes coccinea BRFM310]